MASLPVGIIMLDPDLRISFANPAAVEMAELDPPVPLEGMSYREFLKRTMERAGARMRQEEIEERIAYRIDQLNTLAEGPLIDIKTPSGRALAGTSRGSKAAGC